MKEQSDTQLKEPDTHQFTTPKDRLGYAEEFITVKNGKPANSILL